MLETFEWLVAQHETTVTHAGAERRAGQLALLAAAAVFLLWLISRRK
jgi:MYXO-CTERM domain-containing protein